ncbi:hypothetical protein POM88_047603 [Heracleum sosnowskyi]|uniref:Uncharacterized protein n=1 Tax=Heracleum sosnowskyi TaxID=360622 RepID=A0AAD8LZT4_9APIA|nr:hypothetical protein POM88_047603 [Heracleum sosnowskyi]
MARGERRVPLGDFGEFLNSRFNSNQVKPYWIEKRNAKEDILEISKDDVKEIKEKVLKYGKLIEKNVVKALERGNEDIIRYVGQQLSGRKKIYKEALRKDNLLQDLLKSQYHWIDLNTKKSLLNHEVDVVEIALNQIHFNSLGKGREKVRDKSNQASYAEIVLKGKGEDDGWNSLQNLERDKFKNRIGFVKTSSWKEAKELVEKSRNKLFLGERMSKSLTKSTDDTFKDKPRSVIGDDLKQDPVLKNGKVFNFQSVGSNENQFKCKVKTNTPSHEMLNIEINAELQDILHRSKIGFTYFKMNEVTISDVIKEMGFHEQISITELSSWKFLVSFASQRDMNSFDFELLSSWFLKWEGVEANNFIVQRKAFMECRGLLFVAWSESNLKSISTRKR